MIDPSQVTTSTTYGGVPSVSTFDGSVKLNTGANDLTVHTMDGKLNSLDKEGIHTYDPVQGIERFRSGQMPDSSYETGLTKQNENLPDAF